MSRNAFPKATVLLLATAAVATAHPGHGADGGSHHPRHYLTEPVHLAAAIFALAVVALLVGCYAVSRLRRNPKTSRT